MDVFVDTRLPAGAVRLFGLLARYTGGYYGRRETLAAMVHMKKATIDAYVAKLAGLGYLKITRRKDMPAIITPDSGALAAAGFSTSRINADSDNNMNPGIRFKDLEKTLKTVSNRRTARPFRPPVPPERQHREGTEALRAVGIADPVAADLAGKASPKRIRAAVTYARKKAELNPAGFVIAAIRDGFRLPSWAFAGPAAGRPHRTPEPKGEQVRHTDQVFDRAAVQSAAAASPHRATWEKMDAWLKGYALPANYDAYFAPLVLDDVQPGRILLRAPTAFLAEWVGEHFTHLLTAAAEAAGLGSVAVTVKSAGG